MKTLWAVYTNSDLTEGRGREYIKHFCECQATAIRLSKKGYVQGTDCPVKEITVLELDGKYVLPTSIINIEKPTEDDKFIQEKISARNLVLEKVKSYGFSDEDINKLMYRT